MILYQTMNKRNARKTKIKSNLEQNGCTKIKNKNKNIKKN